MAYIGKEPANVGQRPYEETFTATASQTVFTLTADVDYESDIFDDLSNTAVLLSIDTGVSYEFNTPITINLSAGYNLNTGTGVSGPGTLYPLFYQLSVFYTLFKKS